MTDDPFLVLGLSRNASAEDVRAARRRLAKAVHPDAGGERDEMQRINVAAGNALRHIARRSERSEEESDRDPDLAPNAPAPDPDPDPMWFDAPSFTVEALPAETFQALLVASTALGTVVDDDPPYRLDVALRAPLAGWCRLEILPDAGASTVSLSMAAPAGSGFGVEQLRDRWIEVLNAIDWESAVG